MKSNHFYTHPKILKNLIKEKEIIENGEDFNLLIGELIDN
jgi:hypothetical protein